MFSLPDFSNGVTRFCKGLFKKVFIANTAGELRLRFLGQVPVALEEIWFPGKRITNLSAPELGDSMYLFYQQRLNVWISRVEDQISAATAPDWAPAASPLQTGDWAGYIKRQSWTASNELAEFSKTWFDPKVCRYSSRLSQ